MKYGISAQIFGGGLRGKMQFLEWQWALVGKLNNQTHTTINLEGRIEFGELGDLLDEQIKTIKGLQLMMIRLAVLARRRQNEG